MSWIDQGGTRLAEWLRVQEEITRKWLGDLPGSDISLEATLSQRLVQGWRGLPIERGGRGFFHHRPPREDRLSLWQSENPVADGQEFLSPSVFDSPGMTAEFGAFWPAPDGQHVIVTVLRGGGQAADLVLVAVGDGGRAEIREIMTTPAPAWAAWRDSESFYCSRRIDGVQALSVRTLNGTEIPLPLPITTTGAIVPVVSDDACWVMAAVFEPGLSGCSLLVANNQGTPEFQEVQGIGRNDLGLGWWRPNGPVLLARSATGGREVVDLDLRPLRQLGGRPVPERILDDPQGLLTGVIASPDGEILTIGRASDGGDSFRRLRGDGTLDEIWTPKGISITEWAINGGGQSVLLRVEQWDAPARVFSYDFAHGQFSLLRDSEQSLNLKVSTLEVPGHDSTPIPVTILKAGGAENQPAPCLLYGYGGVGISLRPQYMAGWAPWLEAGGIIAAAHVRGGGELGPAWHEAGRGANKMNSFQDFISVARWLVSEGHAKANGLCSWGQSAGGLLVLGAAVLAPDAFAAVVAYNPVTDMAGFTGYDDDGAYWVTEFGDPLRDPAALAAVAAWSPLHNLTEGTSYPATLVITSKNDRRVSPAHGRKMIAALQASGSKGPHLLLERGDTGHGGPARLSAHIEDQVATQRFAAARTGLNFPPLKALFSAV